MKKYTYQICIISAIVLVLTSVFTGCKKNEKIKEQQASTAEAGNKTEDKAAATQAPKKEDAKSANKGPDKAGAETGVKTENITTAETRYKMQMGTTDVKKEVIYSEDFEDGRTDFTGRGDAGVKIVSDQACDGKNSLFISGRKAAWNGAIVDLTKLLTPDRYTITASVLYLEGPDTVTIDCKVEKNNEKYLNFATASAKKGKWSTFTGNIIILEGTNTAEVYFETSYSGSDLIDFYIDGITITKEVAAVTRGDIPTLKDIYKDRFSIGVAVTQNEISADREELIKQQFNSLTPGNELKPDSVLDYAACASNPEKYNESPAVKFDSMEPIFKFARDSKITMRGHTLVWHSQTPRWFFAEGYSAAANAPLVSKELMQKRMENYIRQVMEYTQKNYPGMIYAWDVVNEAINSDGAKDDYRSKDSLWYQVIGPEYIENAFEYARKYAAKDVKLFYNDYNTEDPGKMMSIYNMLKGLQEKELVDGIGLQSHIAVSSPSLINIESSIRKYSELGLEIQITELDMDMAEKTDEALMNQAKRYKRLFTMLKYLDESGAANITNVTFWGLSDDISWLIKPDKNSYPLLFDQYLVQKPAFWGVVLSPDIPLY